MLGVPRIALATALLVHSVLVVSGWDDFAEHNPYPCMTSPAPVMYSIFMKHHVPSGQPNSLDQNQWESFIKKHHLCHRHTQSFLHSEDKEKILEVCTPSGGKRLEGDLCISNQEFQFTTVRLGNSCSIRSITPEKKNIIVACDEINNQCLPVHFEGNSQDKKPDNNMAPCQSPDNTDYYY